MTTVVLPIGPMEQACIGTVNFNSCSDSPWFNASSNYVTICCDGGIINTAWSIWAPGQNLSSNPWNLDDFACCERDVWSTPDITTCSENTHQTALASLAGTNTDNFQYWTDTYLTGMAQTPRCAWLSIGTGEVTTVTVAKQTGTPDTTKITDSSTTRSEIVDNSESHTSRATATDSSIPTRSTPASVASTHSSKVDASGTSSALAAAQSTSDFSSPKSLWGVIFAICSFSIVSVI